MQTKTKQRVIVFAVLGAMLLGLAGCGTKQDPIPSNADTESAAVPSAPTAAPAPEASTQASEVSAASVVEGPSQEELLAERFTDYAQDFDALTFDPTQWNYDAENGVYYQIGVPYCSAPEALDYETMGIYVPEEYMTATDNGDGTFTCTVNASGSKGGFTAENAPIILPVDTPGYSAQAAPTSYNYAYIADYLDAGFIYVWAGMRGRASLMGGSGSLGYSGGVPYGVTDLKAAVRYYRFNETALPGSVDRFFSFGMSGGGAQSSLIGATGDSELYYPYLTSIGAAMKTEDGAYISDAICGSMCWCPITSLDYADAAYEWNMGQYFDTGSRDPSTYTSALSMVLAAAFAEYINDLGLTDEDGNVLTLEQSKTGVYAAGSYYDYILSEIETSLNNFLSDTEFPYVYTARGIQVGNTAESGGGWGGFGGGPDSSAGTTYEPAQDYIDSLNTDMEWVTYDEATNTAQITSIGDFVTHCKNAQKYVGAFDSPDNVQGENNLFGNGQDVNMHFDAVEGAILEENASLYAEYPDWNEENLQDFQAHLNATDDLGVSMQTRVDMYNPMYYLCDYYEGAGTSNVAKYWRIRTGIAQTDTALTVEENLKLALMQCEDVESVDFATVWAQPHTTAERTGTSTGNFIAWVYDCLGAQAQG